MAAIKPSSADNNPALAEAHADANELAAAVEQVKLASFTGAQKEEARAFLGRRIELRKLVDQGKADPALLDAHTELLLESRKEPYKGFFFKLEKDGKSIGVLGTAHSKLYQSGVDYDIYSLEERRDFMLAVLHPTLKENVLNSKLLFVELNTLEQGVSWEFLMTLAEQKRPDPRKFSPLIEQTADKCERAFGQDTALMVLARSNDIKISALENPKVQEKALTIALEAQQKDPHHIIFTSESRLEEIDAVQFANWDSMVQITRELPEAIQRDNLEREENMAKQTIALLESGQQATVAFGANHLLTVLDRVARANIKVTPIPLA